MCSIKEKSFSLYRFSLIFKIKALHNWLFKSSVITKTKPVYTNCERVYFRATVTLACGNRTFPFKSSLKKRVFSLNQ